MSCRKGFVKTIMELMDNRIGTVGVEIGCDRGGMSNEIVGVMQPSTFYMIDPWETIDNIRNGPRNADAMVERYDTAMNQPNIKDNPVVIVLKMKSSEGIPTIPDASLDWAFVDGDHTYFGCLSDLDNLLPKMKSGGIIFGDDYEWANTYGDEEADNSGKVKRAFEEFKSVNEDVIAHTEILRDNIFIIKLK